VHGTGVVEVRQPPGPGADEPEGDAAVTGTPGVVLAILTADCLPVVFCNRAGTRIGVAHAGWRGLEAGVLEATVAAMEVPAASLMAWLGPAAGPERYEVGTEVRDAFLAHDPAAAAAFTATRPGHWHVDLYTLARQRLIAAGLSAGAIHGGGLCTISDEARFFSHRRDGHGGRMPPAATSIGVPPHPTRRNEPAAETRRPPGRAPAPRRDHRIRVQPHDAAGEGHHPFAGLLHPRARLHPGRHA